MTYTIVRSNRLNIFSRKLDTDFSILKNMFKLKSFTDKIILELCLKLHIKIPARYFNPLLIKDESDVIIVFDGHARKEFLEWLADNNKGKRLIFWCWNTIEEIETNFKIKDIPPNYEIWSYSKHDCQRWNLKYNTTFYWTDYTSVSDREKQFDIYFIGKDKGRLKKIEYIKKICSEVNINTFFQIVPTHKWNYNKKYSLPISYEEVMNNIAKSKSILDIKVNKNAGPSLRALEATLCKKLLITDDGSVTDFKFYNPQNILILNKNVTGKRIKDFLKEAFIEPDNSDIKYYSFRNWLHRF